MNAFKNERPLGSASKKEDTFSTTILQQTLKGIKAQEYVEKNVMPKIKTEAEAASKKNK